MELGFKASPYGSSRYNGVDFMNLAQSSTSENYRRSYLDFGEGHYFKEALAIAQEYLDLESSEDVPLEDLPENFRWDDILGYDFTSQVKD